MKILTTDVVETLQRPASCRAFTSEDVPDDLLGPLLHAATRAPTSFSLQPYALVTVRGAESRDVLAAAAGGSVPLTAAPVAVVICTDLARVERIAGMSGELLAGQHDDAMLSSVIDASMAGLCLALAAESACDDRRHP
jgi:nitroreductase